MEENQVYKDEEGNLQIKEPKKDDSVESQKDDQADTINQQQNGKEEQKYVPIEVFKSMTDKNNALKEEIGELKKQVDKVSQNVTKEQQTRNMQYLHRLEDNLEEARDSGDSAKVSELREQISQAKQRLLEQDITEIVGRAFAQNNMVNKLEEVIEKVNAEYPELDPEAPEYNPDILDMVIAVRDKKINEGDLPYKAITKAVKQVMGREKTGNEDTRSKQALNRGLDADINQPDNPITKVKTANQKIDIGSMSDEEYDKLTEKQKQVLRGDNF